MTKPLDCGDCSMCCKIPNIPRAEGDVIFNPDREDGSKLEGEWCQHCRPGKGVCSVYEDRGPTCREYKCVWLQSQDRGAGAMPLSMRPDKSKVMLQPTVGGRGMIFRVLPENWGAWQKGTAKKLLMKLWQSDLIAFAADTRGRRAALTPAAQDAVLKFTEDSDEEA